MFGFNFRSLAEAAINTLTGTSQTDVELSKLVKEAELQDSSFINIVAISKELEKQLHAFVETNSSILRSMESLDRKDGKRCLSVDVWGKASRFYYSIGAVKNQLIPDTEEKVLAIRSDIAHRSETLHDIKIRVSAYNRKQVSIADDEDLLKQLKSREDLISAHYDSQKDVVSQTRDQVTKLSSSIDADKQKHSEERLCIVGILQSMIEDNKKYVQDTLKVLYDLFASTYANIAKIYSEEIPADITALNLPLFPDQADVVMTISVSAGSMRQHSISVTKGSHVKWLFNCDDSNIRFSVVLSSADGGDVVNGSDAVIIEKEHKVNADGRYDVGEYICEHAGVLSLIWDNTYSLILGKDIHLRVAVKHPKVEVVTSTISPASVAVEAVEIIGSAVSAENVVGADSKEIEKATENTVEEDKELPGEKSNEQVEVIAAEELASKEE